MKGTALIYRPDATAPEVRELDRSPDLEALQKAVGGYIELVPHFNTISWEGEPRACVVFCNEEGKLEGLPVNRTATALWHMALPAPGLRRADGGVADVLVGAIIVLFGDPEFMAAL